MPMFQLLAAAYSAAAASSYLVFIIIIIFLGSTNNISTSTASAQFTCYDYTAGQNSVNCLSRPLMEYPFWRMDELLQQQQPQRYYCGYPGFGITCTPYNEGRLPTINIFNQSYYVTEDEVFVGIRSVDRRLTIVDPDFLKTACPRPRRNFTFNQRDFSDDSAIRLISDNSELTFFLNCTSPPPRLPIIDYVNRPHLLGCLNYTNNDTMMTMSSYGFFDWEFERLEINKKLLADWNGKSCKETVVVQASSTSKRDSTVGYMQILQRGFEVIWSTPGQCQRCESSGGFCSFKYGNPITYKCWCKDERQLRRGADGREYCFDYGTDSDVGPSTTN